MLIRSTRILLPLAMFCLVGAILLKRFVGQSGSLAFIEGILIGAALVLNIAYLVRSRHRDEP